MARIENVVITDDFDGSEGASTVVFGLDGRSYEIDLSVENETELRDFLTHYIQRARRPRTGRTTAATPAAAKNEDISAIRAWAKENNFEVSDRGRISSEVRSAYAEAH
jgi:hypothetical protein